MVKKKPLEAPRMKFNQHYNLVGKHAFLSPSGYHWLNYDGDKMRAVYENNKKKEHGTYLHDLASRLINERIKVDKLKKAFNQFVNDAIGFNMDSEVTLYYSDNCFGTSDAILFKDNHLQIHDLKTGDSKPSFKQLDVYAALFCLEYDVSPFEITIEERLYQGMGYTELFPEPEHIKNTMDKIIYLDQVIDELKNQ